MCPAKESQCVALTVPTPIPIPPQTPLITRVQESPNQFPHGYTTRCPRHILHLHEPYTLDTHAGRIFLENMFIELAVEYIVR